MKLRYRVGSVEIEVEDDDHDKACEAFEWLTKLGASIEDISPPPDESPEEH